MTELAALARVSLCSSDPEDSSDEDTAGEQAQTANTRKYTLCVKYEMHIPFYSMSLSFMLSHLYRQQ